MGWVRVLQAVSRYLELDHASVHRNEVAGRSSRAKGKAMAENKDGCILGQ